MKLKTALLSIILCCQLPVSAFAQSEPALTWQSALGALELGSLQNQAKLAEVFFGESQSSGSIVEKQPEETPELWKGSKGTTSASLAYLQIKAEITKEAAKLPIDIEFVLSPQQQLLRLPFSYDQRWQRGYQLNCGTSDQRSKYQTIHGDSGRDSLVAWRATAGCKEINFMFCPIYIEGPRPPSVIDTLRSRPVSVTEVGIVGASAASGSFLTGLSNGEATAELVASPLIGALGTTKDWVESQNPKVEVSRTYPARNSPEARSQLPLTFKIDPASTLNEIVVGLASRLIFKTSRNQKRTESKLAIARLATVALNFGDKPVQVDDQEYPWIDPQCLVIAINNNNSSVEFSN